MKFMYLTFSPKEARALKEVKKLKKAKSWEKLFLELAGIEHEEEQNYN